MKLPTSMCSGPIRHSPPRELSTPSMRRTFDSIPSMSAPSVTRKRQRSWMCGSQAALPITVSPGVERGGHDRVLGRHHARLVEEDVLARAGRPCAARSARRCRSRRRARRARGCAGRAGGGRSRRRPAAGTLARPKRASSGPASRNEARMRLDELGVELVRRERPAAWIAAPRSRPSTRRPRRAAASSAIIVSTSRIRGTLLSTTGSLRRAGRRRGSAARRSCSRRRDAAAQRLAALDDEGLGERRR